MKKLKQALAMLLALAMLSTAAISEEALPQAQPEVQAQVEESPVEEESSEPEPELPEPEENPEPSEPEPELSESEQEPEPSEPEPELSEQEMEPEQTQAPELGLETEPQPEPFEQPSEESIELEPFSADSDFVIDESGILTSYTGMETDLVLPPEVMAIGMNAFLGNTTLRSVTMPYPIARIQPHAFENCVNLERVQLPDTLGIMATAAFKGCSKLREINIPPTLNIIQPSTFENCASLRSVSIPSGVDIDTFAFVNCTGLESVELPGDLKELKAHAFDGCTALKSVTLPAALTKIDSFAFSGCTALASVDMASCGALEEIGTDAFENCRALESLDMPDSVRTVGSLAFSGTENLGRVKLSANLTKLGDLAFQDSGVTSIQIPGTLGAVPMTCFAGCARLADVELGEGITKIDSNAFADCPLERISIPGTVIEISNRAFKGCATLRQVELNEGLVYIRNGAFMDCTALEEITLPNTLQEIESMAFNGATGLRTVRFPADSLRTLGSSAFSETGIETLDFPDSLTEVPENAFAACKSLREVRIPEGVTSVGERAFQLCSALQTVRLPESLTLLGDSAFTNCKALTDINLPSKLTKLGGSMFTGCTSLESITIPRSITTFGKNAFGLGSRNLKLRVYAGSAAESYAKSEGIDYVLIPEIRSAGFEPANPAVGQSVRLRVVTDPEATVLEMLDESGDVYKQWTNDPNRATLTDAGLEWSTEFYYFSAGERNYTLRAGDGTSYGATMPLQLVVLEDAVPEIRSATVSPNPVQAGEEVVFTASVDANAEYIRLLQGSKILAGWTREDAEVVASGNAESWTLRHSFAATGDYSLSLQASADNSHFSAEYPLSLTVEEAVTVTGVKAGSAIPGVETEFEVTASANARCIALCDAQGQQLALWTDEEAAPTISGTKSVWKLRYTFTEPGELALRMRAGKSPDQLGPAYAFTLSVSAPMNVLDVQVLPDPIQMGQKPSFTVRTPASATKIQLYTADGTDKGRWDVESANTVVSGGERVWSVAASFTLRDEGTFDYTMQMSVDGRNYGPKYPFTIQVVSSLAAVYDVQFSPEVAKVGKPLNFTVKTSTDAESLTLYNARGTRLWNWSASVFSSVEGDARVFRGSYTFQCDDIAAPGVQRFTMRASWDRLESHNGAPYAFDLDVEYEPDILSVEASPAMVGKPVTFTLRVPFSGKYVALFDASGARLKLWDQNSASYSAATDSWKVEYTFAEPGEIELYWAASEDGLHFGPKYALRLTVQDGIMMERIELTAERLTLVVGKSEQLTAYGYPIDATNRAIRWSSADERIATVSRGNVTAVAPGTTQITCAALDGSGVTAVCSVMVVKRLPKSLKLSASKMTLGVGDSGALSVKSMKPAGSGSFVTYRSANENIATVDPQTGRVKALKTGKVKITARAVNGKKASCTVTVKKAPTQITLNQSELTLAALQEAQLKVTLPKKTAAGLKWWSSRYDVAFVDDSGSILAVGPGTTRITVTAHNYTEGNEALRKTCLVTVLPAPTELIMPEALTLGKGEKYTLEPRVQEGSQATFTFETDAKKTVSVDSKGKLTAKKTGSTNIWVTTHNGLTLPCAVTVLAAPKKLNISEKKLTLSAGASQTVSVTLPTGTASYKLTPNSNKPKIATVEPVPGKYGEFTIKAISPGKATITIKTFNGKKATVSVTVS